MQTRLNQKIEAESLAVVPKLKAPKGICVECLKKAMREKLALQSGAN
jgi:type VI secretion system secreted protein VgrG